jgi:hypothetical protein
MQIQEKVTEIEEKLQLEKENAKSHSELGLNSPEIVVSNIEGHFYEMLGHIQSKIIGLEEERINLDKNLQPLKNTIHDSENKIISEWNLKERTVTTRSEAEAGIRNFQAESKFKLKEIFFYMLFLAEFSYGYYIFKNIVLPDNTFQNYVTSIVVGAMVLLIGIFTKLIPDSQTDVKRYDFYKKIITGLAIISMSVFLLCLVQMREATDSFDLTKATAKVSNVNYQELVFNLCLLCTIIFGSAFFNHWSRVYPKKLLKKRHDEGVELLHWYESEQFSYRSASNKFNDTTERLEIKIKPNLQFLKEQVAKYDQNYLKALKRQALSYFVMGTQTMPVTDSKEKARVKAESILSILN